MMINNFSNSNITNDNTKIQQLNEQIKIYKERVGRRDETIKKHVQ